MLFMDGWIRKLVGSKSVISTQLVILLQGFESLVGAGRNILMNFVVKKKNKIPRVYIKQSRNTRNVI